MAEKTLWEKLGGERQMKSIIDQFVDRAIGDPEVNYSRNGRFPLDEASIAFSKRSALEFFSAAAGGPLQYTGRSLTEIHQDMRINEAEFDAIALDFRRALESHEVAQDLVDETMAKVEATRPLIVTVRRI